MFSTWQAVSTLDRMFDDVMGSSLGTATGRSARRFEPSIDVRANQDEVVFVCDVPGVKQDDLDVTLENQVLTIKGARKYVNEQNEQVVLERAYGAFQRAFTLPEHLDASRLEASLADGVLTIRIPKVPKAKPRKIAIGNGSGTQHPKLP
jgi:HSP20 family protein